MANKQIRKLSKTGHYGYSVLIPPEWIRELGWRGKQKLTVKKQGRKIIIEDWKDG